MVSLPLAPYLPRESAKHQSAPVLTVKGDYINAASKLRGLNEDTLH